MRHVEKSMRVPSCRRLLPAVAVLLLALVLAACGASAGGGDPAGGVYDGTALDGEAPGFRLTDQRDESIALSDFHGSVVVVAFLDPNCTDICPLTAMHFRQAHRALGEDADRAAFLAVNTNPNAATVGDVAAATERWRMSGMPNWHFLTGTAEELQEVWRGYAAYGGLPDPHKPDEVQHTPGVYVIDRDGDQDRYISVAFDPSLALDELLAERIRALLGS